MYITVIGLLPGIHDSSWFASGHFNMAVRFDTRSEYYRVLSFRSKDDVAN
jgi:hypothetical protein